jgi:hypothetical protein
MANGDTLHTASLIKLLQSFQANKQVSEPQTCLFAIVEKDKLSALQECWGSRMALFDKIGLTEAIPPRLLD